MLIKEKLTKSDFMYQTKKTSKISGATIDKERMMHCPNKRCNNLFPETEHDEYFTCPKCGLRIYTLGNSIECEIESTKLLHNWLTKIKNGVIGKK